MYDFYPEWGPARHREDEPQSERRARYWQDAERTPAMAGAPEARDAEAERPDDN
jgi:hypothetical protein